MIKAIEGYLDISKRYKLVDVIYGKIESNKYTTRCENCGNKINNVAIIEDEDEEQYGVGLDCMEILTGLKDSEKAKARSIIMNRRHVYNMLHSDDIKSVLRKGNKIRLYNSNTTKWSPVYHCQGEYDVFEDLIRSLGIQVIEVGEN